MSTHISWLLQVTIQPGKLNDFRGVAHDLIENSKVEPGTLDYEWHLTADQSACHIFERYADNDAVLKHIASFAPYAPRFLEACYPTRFDIYGDPSAAVKEALADFRPNYYTDLGGFSR